MYKEKEKLLDVGSELKEGRRRQGHNQLKGKGKMRKKRGGKVLVSNQCLVRMSF